MARCAVGGWNAPRRPRQCTRHGVVLRSVSGVCGGGTHKCVLQPLQCWERSVAVSRHCGCARRALGADRDRDRTLCVDLMCGYRPVSCADPDGIAIYINLTRVTGFPIGHARRVPRRHDGRCATSRTEHRRAAGQPHIERDPRSRRPGTCGAREGAPPRAEANYSTPLVRLSPLRSRNTHVSERNMKQQRNEAAPRNGCRCGSPGRLGPSLRPL